MGDIDDAKNMEEVSESAMTMLVASLETYRKVQLSLLESFTGAKPMDAEACAKDVQTWVGTMARDLGNLATVWQKAMQVMAPAASTDGTQGGPGGAGGGGSGGPNG